MQANSQMTKQIILTVTVNKFKEMNPNMRAAATHLYLSFSITHQPMPMPFHEEPCKGTMEEKLMGYRKPNY